MLHLFFSNRHETLADALIEHLASHPGAAGPWARQQVIVPSAALRRRLELDIAGRHGICANLEFSYLAQWLWTQIGQVLRVPPRSPFAPDRLVWRCYRLLSEAVEVEGEDGGMAEAVEKSLQYLSAEDLAAIATYLKDSPPVRNPKDTRAAY
ncbi:exodeoxyribonuclease V subunit gamma, partial [Burkholderia sp. Tr-860]|uniref:exodeoxyribonuclease V subunit gamma n=1 Tax=Burkholderia sp. Tr-860 TaxID=2608338 RepID=UPI001F036463